MGLLDNLLNQAVGSHAGPRKAIFRVLLDDEGRVQDVVLKRSSGDRAIDLQGMTKFLNMKFPPGRLGSGPKKSRRWHEFSYTEETSE